VRIGIDVRVADPAEPGQQRYLWRLGAWLAEGGREVHYLTARAQREDVTLPESTVLHRLGGLSRRRLRAAVGALELDVLLLNPERSRRYRGLPANVLRSAYGTEQYLQKLRSFGRPAEHALRSALRAAPWTLAEMRWERAFYEDRTPPPDVIAQSRYMRGQILASYRVPPEHVHVVHNAVDTSEYTPTARLALRDEMRRRWSVPDEALCLLFLGHNFRLKGLWQILEALPAVGDVGRPVHLVVAGKGTGSGQRRKAERLVRAAGVERRVTFAGPVRPALHALAVADALLHLSWHDSFGFVTLEAMASGLPVVTTEWVGASELIEHGRSGLLVDPADDGQIVAAIRSLCDDATRVALGAAAAEIGALHDERSNFEQVLHVMRRAVDRGGEPIR
jgi:glycosyltransferase involved in cell wall biosynthesis